MEDGPIGLCGLNAVPLVKEELVKEAESVTTPNHNLMARTVLVTAPKLRVATNTTVQVSLNHTSKTTPLVVDKM